MRYPIPAEFSEVYELSRAEYLKSGVFFLDEDYVRGLCRKTSAFQRTLDSVISGANELKGDSEAAIYALFLCYAMENREKFRASLTDFFIPDKDFPLLAFLCFLPYIDRLHDFLTEKHLPDDVLLATLRQFEDCLFLYEERFGRIGMNDRYFRHLQGYVDMRIFNIGRLRFERYTVKDACVVENKETGEQTLFVCGGEMNEDGLYADTPPIKKAAFEAFFEEREDSFIGTAVNARGRCEKAPVRLQKSNHFLRIPNGADCISVHIPAGRGLTREACEESYKRAADIFSRLFPEREFKAFRCHSWMMAPELEEILKPGSNLLEFQKPYAKYPCRTKGEDVLNFVFKMKFTTYDDLPEDTSLQRELKKIYLSGEYLYEYNGLFSI